MTSAKTNWLRSRLQTTYIGPLIIALLLGAGFRQLIEMVSEPLVGIFLRGFNYVVRVGGFRNLREVVVPDQLYRLDVVYVFPRAAGGLVAITLGLFLGIWLYRPGTGHVQRTGIAG